MAAISRSAPGKLILCGEHAVVYHQPAIAVPVTRISTTTKILAAPLAPKGMIRINAPQVGINGPLEELPDSSTLRQSIKIIQDFFKLDHLPACEIRISSTIPIGSGLGSSASSSVSLIRALSDFLGAPLADEQTNRLAFEMEKLHHGSPSGIDNTVITHAQSLFFIRDEPVEFLQPGKPLDLIIADTGIHALTVSAVTQVRERYQGEPQRFGQFFEEIGDISQQVRQFFLDGKTFEIGQLLTRNHKILQELGVSCPELDRLVIASLESGAAGAKLSGGGLGGNMLALVDETCAARVEENLLASGAVSVIHTTIN
jgi:mevalonate kinase